MRSFDTVIQFLATKKGVGVILLLVLTVGVFTTINQISQVQDTRQQAGFYKEPSSCDECMLTDNRYFCRNAAGTTSCQPRDISGSFAGMVCIDCENDPTIPDDEVKTNLIDDIWEKVLTEIEKIDANKNGRIEAQDLNIHLQNFLTGK